jgi:hypothetical protein
VVRWQVVRQVGMSWHGMDFGVVGLRKRVGLGKYGELFVLIVRV